MMLIGLSEFSPRKTSFHPPILLVVSSNLLVEPERCADLYPAIHATQSTVSTTKCRYLLFAAIHAVMLIDGNAVCLNHAIVGVNFVRLSAAATLQQ